MPTTSRSNALIVWILLLIAIGGLLVGYNYVQMVAEMTRLNKNLAPIKEVPRFSMMNQDGKEITPAALKGKIWIADFFFTRCPGPCLLLTKQLLELQKELPKDINFVSFTVDPEYDTPAILKKYGTVQGSDFDRWTFLTADKTQMREVIIKGFMTPVADQTDPDLIATQGPLIHSTLFALVDQKGRIRKYYEGLDEGAIQELKKAIKYLQSPESQ